jgi:ABC-type oligopeptide transport system substrate-binding subunit
MTLDAALAASRISQAGFYHYSTLYVITYEDGAFESLYKYEEPKKPGKEHKRKNVSSIQFETKFGVSVYEYQHWKPIAPKKAEIKCQWAHSLNNSLLTIGIKNKEQNGN